jgi:hypothetical protein
MLRPDILVLLACPKISWCSVAAACAAVQIDGMYARLKQKGQAATTKKKPAAPAPAAPAQTQQPTPAAAQI